MSERKMHWIGRMLAEQKTSDEVWFCTFTYGRSPATSSDPYQDQEDHPDAYWLKYGDLQKTFKKIRRAGFKFSYLAVGEYGSEKGRAHFHAVIFWKGKSPERPLGVRLNMPNEKDPAKKCPFWELGIVQYEHPRSNTGAAAYMMEYLDKDNLQRNALRYSKRPGLGHEYLVEYARRHARAGLALFQNGPSFTIDDSVNKKGNLFFYRLDPNSKIYEEMIEAWFDEWTRVRPGEPLVMSDEIRPYIEEICQDTSALCALHQVYLARCYGYEPVREIDFTHTIYTLDSYCLFDTFGCKAIVINNEGTEIWRETLEELGELLEPNGHKARRPIAAPYKKAFLRHAPLRVLEYLRRQNGQFISPSEITSEIQSRKNPKLKPPAPAFRSTQLISRATSL